MQMSSSADVAAVSAVMRTELTTIDESGMSVKQVGKPYFLSLGQVVYLQSVESLMSRTYVKGFPIVSSDGARTLVGYIGRTEMRHVLGTKAFDFLT